MYQVALLTYEGGKFRTFEKELISGVIETEIPNEPGWVRWCLREDAHCTLFLPEAWLARLQKEQVQDGKGAKVR